MDFLREFFKFEDLEPEPKLTKAQQQLLQKREKEEKKRIEQHQEQKLLMRDHLKRELEMSRKTMNVLNDKWHKIMEEIHLRDLKTDIQAWQSKLEWTLKHKDNILKLVLEQMEQTEELNRRVFASHMNTQNYLCELFQFVISKEKQRHEAEVEECLKEFRLEMDRYDAYERDFKKRLENIEMNRYLVTELELWDDLKIYVQRLDDNIIEEAMQRENRRDKIVREIRDMHSKVVKFITELKSASVDDRHYERVLTLTQNQESYRERKEFLDEYEARTTRALLKLQHSRVMHDANTQRKVSSLNNEFAYFSNINDRLFNERELATKMTMERIKLLAEESHKAIDYFRNYVSAGEKMLSLLAVCRKLETEEEKVQTLHDPKVHKSAGIVPTRREQQRIIDVSKYLDTNEADLMRFFIKRLAIVQGKNLVLQADKEKLEAENRSLLEQFKRLGKKVDAGHIKNAVTYNRITKKNNKC